MNSRRWVLVSLCFGCIVLVAIYITLAADDPKETERPITWNELPEVVQETILENAGNSTITELEEVTVGDQTFFEAEWMEEGMEVEILVAADGELIEREVEEPDEDDDDEDGEPKDED